MPDRKKINLEKVNASPASNPGDYPRHGQATSEQCDNLVVMEPSQRGLPTWVVIVTAIVAPILLGILFITAMDAGRLSDSDWRRDPNAGYTQSYTNDAIMFLYVVVQIGFLIVAPFAMTRRPGLRTAFWAIAVPLCLLIALIAMIGQFAG